MTNNNNNIMTQRTSYQYDIFMNYQNSNNKLPPELVPYCSYEYSTIAPDIMYNFGDSLQTIISSITKGDDANNVVFRNWVKSYINFLQQDNYNEYYQKLKKLNYTSEENICFLINELIICAIRCPISVKGFIFQEESNYKSVPELCADMLKQFSTTIVKCNDVDINFHVEIMKICRQWFINFMDLNKSLDENNENTSDNYKGFMTFIGLLFSRGIINTNIIIDCIDSIKRSIYCKECNDKHEKHSCTQYLEKMSGIKKNISIPDKNKIIVCFGDCDSNCKSVQITYRKHIECMNLHKGYQHLMHHVVKALDVKIIEFTSNYDKMKLSLYDETNEQNVIIESKINKLVDYVDSIIGVHQDFIQLNKLYQSQNKSTLVIPLNTYTLLMHNAIGTNLNKLREKLLKYTSKPIKEYSNVLVGK